MSFKDIIYLQLWQPLCLPKRNQLCNFGKGPYEEHFCEIILNLDQWPRRRYYLNIFVIESSGIHFVLQSETICAMLVESIMRKISVK